MDLDGEGRQKSVFDSDAQSNQHHGMLSKVSSIQRLPDLTHKNIHIDEFRTHKKPRTHMHSGLKIANSQNFMKNKEPEIDALNSYAPKVSIDARVNQQSADKKLLRISDISQNLEKAVLRSHSVIASTQENSKMLKIPSSIKNRHILSQSISVQSKPEESLQKEINVVVNKFSKQYEDIKQRVSPKKYRFANIRQSHDLLGKKSSLPGPFPNQQSQLMQQKSDELFSSIDRNAVNQSMTL